MNSTRILFIAPTPPPVTGQSVACELLYTALLEKGHEIVLVNLSKNGFKQGVNSLGRVFEILRVFFRVWTNYRKADVIYFTPSESLAGNLKDLIILFLIGSARNKTIIHLHGGAGMRIILGEKYPALRRANILMLKNIRGVIVLGERLKDIYKGAVCTEKIHSVANFAGDDFFLTKIDIEEKFLKSRPLRLLFLSNLLPGKGYKELFAALLLLPSEIQAKVHLDFAGGFETPNDENIFRAQVAEFDNVSIHGVVHGDEKKNLFRNAHVFCLPTYYPYEGQPISILEAYASGCAVFTTDHSGIFDIFTPEINGFQVEPRSPESIANAILQALDNPRLLREIGLRNSYEANQKYRSSNHLEKMKDVFCTKEWSAL